MSGVPSDIERRLADLADEPRHKSFLERTLMKVVVFITWFLLLASVAGCIYIYLQWSTSTSETNTYRTKIRENSATLNRTRVAEKQCRKELDTLAAELKAAKEEANGFTKKIAELDKEIVARKSNVSALNSELTQLTHEIAQLVATNTELKAHQQKLEKELEDVTTIHKAVSEELKLATRDMNIWKAFVGLGIIGGSVLGINEVSLHAKVWKAEEELTADLVKKEAFEPLTVGFANAVFMERLEGHLVTHDICFTGARKGGLEACVGRSPTITTITTTKGYRFGVFLSIPWTTDEGTHADAQAFAFSTNHVLPAKANDHTHAFTVSKDTFLHFGTTDVVISADGRMGTASAGAFTVPIGYKNDDFFLNGTSFNVKEITIDVLTIA